MSLWSWITDRLNGGAAGQDQRLSPDQAIALQQGGNPGTPLTATQQQFYKSSEGGAGTAGAEVATALGEAQRYLYTNLISRPLTTAMFYADPYDPLGNSTDLRANWKQSEFVSPGQEIVAGFNNYIPDLKQADPKQARNEVNAAIVQRRQVGFYNSDGTWKSGFKDNPWANLVSGTSDASFSWFLDPLVVAGKGAKVTRSTVVDRVATPGRVAGLRAETRAGTGGMGTLLDEMDEFKTLPEFMSHKFVQDSADPTALGRALWSAGEAAPVFGSTAKAERAKVILASLGDDAAIKELKETRAALADVMEITRSKFGEVPEATPTLLDSYRTVDSYLDAALGRAENAGVTNVKLGRSTTSKVTAIEINRAHRAKVFGATDVGMSIETVQKAPGWRPMHIVSRPAQTRPQGVVRLSGPAATDGYTELQSQLMRARGMSPEQRVELLEQYGRAANLPQRKAAIEAIDQAAVESVAMEYGLSATQAREYAVKLLAKKNGAVEKAIQNNYLEDVDGLLGEAGGIIHDAQFVSQLSDSVPLIDLDHLRRSMPFVADQLKVASRSQVYAARTRAAGDIAWDGINEVIDTVWRPLVLIRGGYAPRNVGEAWMRMAALAMLPTVLREQGPEGVGYWIQNRIAGVQYQGVKALRGADDAATGAAKRRVENPKMGGKGRRSFKGVGFDDAFEGGGGAAAREAASENVTLARQLRPGEAGFKEGSARGAEWTRRVRPDDEYLDNALTPEAQQYWDDYTRVVNQHLGTDPVSRMLLEGKSRQEVAAWLRGDKTTGLRSEKGLTRATVDQHVDLVANYIDGLVPVDLWGDVLKGGLSPQEYAARLRDVATAPVAAEKIIGDLNKSLATGAVDAWRKGVSWIFKQIGQKPTDTLVRNPYFRDRYRSYMETFIETARRNGDEVTDDVIKGWETQARKGTLRDLKRDIYTVERYSNVAMALRPIAPFIAATNNTLTTWARIIGKDPSVAAKVGLVWNAPTRAGMVVDLQTYQPVDQNSTVPMTGRYGIAIPLPAQVKKVMGLPDDYKLIPPQASFNVALQSDPFWLPGWGPMVTIPFAYWANKEPDNSVVKMLDGLIFPRQGDIQGSQVPRNPLVAALPAWLRQTLNKNDPDGTARNGVMAAMVAKERQKAYETGDFSFFDPQGKWRAEIERRVEAYFTFRQLGAGALPFAANLQDPEAQFYINKAREYNRQGEINGVTGDERFLADYGEAFYAYTFAVTRNVTAVAADSAVQRRLDNLDPALRAAVAEYNPTLLGVIVNNPDGSYNFSSPTFNKQTNERVSIQDIRPMRQTQSGIDAVEQTQEQLGWERYIAARNQLDAFMRSNGITSLARAEGLRAQWQQYVATLEQTYPEWARARQQRDDGQFNANAQGFQLILDSGVGSDRQEFGTMAAYLSARKTLQDYLASGAAPAKTLTAQANAGVREQWEAYVRQLTGSDPRFADLYFRYFDGEFVRLEDASNGTE